MWGGGAEPELLPCPRSLPIIVNHGDGVPRPSVPHAWRGIGCFALRAGTSFPCVVTVEHALTLFPSLPFSWENTVNKSYWY